MYVTTQLLKTSCCDNSIVVLAYIKYVSIYLCDDKQGLTSLLGSRRGVGMLSKALAAPRAAFLTKASTVFCSQP